MTELEAQLLNMLEAEKQEAERERIEVEKERNELRSMLQSIARQQQQIIELLSKPSEGDSLETTLQRVLNGFQNSLIESLAKSLNESKNL
jgi:uncharacterized membrane-anchored protein YhcB (DUF1043 family)